jgi:hypothetical protein
VFQISINNVSYLLKARIVEPEETSVAREYHGNNTWPEAEGSTCWSQQSQYEVGLKWSPARKDDSEAEEHFPLEAATKRRDWGKYSMCDNDPYIVVTSCKIVQ